ncbi:hypothetical protein MSTO_03700 [Mycobacterium stomatepiae]|uniref:Uncharacterized protein n=1 Tax=Mycobacterium stomatepiae TaxID=470076 RepID=A0A7I7Q1D3_9MYCO|nr:hypothetical protein MSTO_03700 [Mycobacterium stomatepiae]
MSAKRYRGFDQLGKAPQGVFAAASSCDGRREILGNALIQGGADEITFGREPTIQSPFTDTRAVRYRFHGRIWAQFAVDVARGAKNALDVARRVRPQLPIFQRCHRHSLTDS